MLACAVECQPAATDADSRDATYKGHNPSSPEGLRHAKNTVASDHHDRYEFHAETVHAADTHEHHTAHDEVIIYRTNKHDFEHGSAANLHMLPSCKIVDGWYLSINDSPFHKVKALPVAHEIQAKCAYVYEEGSEWPRERLSKQTRGDTKVVFVREQPDSDPELKWKDEL